MSRTVQARQGMTVAPHALAAEAGLAVLRDGGNAAEAAIAMAAALAVLYPHMSGIGGDSFWLLAAADGPVTAIDACGRTALGLNPDAYRATHEHMPHRGPWAASTVAGTVSGWQAAWEHSRARWHGRLPLSRLLEAAVHYARAGCVASESQSRCTMAKFDELMIQPGFAAVFGDAQSGCVQRQPALARTLERLRSAGLDDFYRGELAASMATELQALGSPLRYDDFRRHRAEAGAPLALSLGGRLGRGTVFTTAPPTQGLATLLILGQFDRSAGWAADAGAWVHFLVEATKSAFEVRDASIRDPQDMVPLDYEELLSVASLAKRAARIDPHGAAAWRGAGGGGDTTWFGAVDGMGRAVSCIQSIYHEFGSGVVLGDTGVCWQNRSASFSLERVSPRALRPGRKPFHTLCPSLARLGDGRMLVFGTMGGDGQPQTQAAFLTRYLHFGFGLQEAISAPRWLLGRTWGAASDSLKLEGRFSKSLIEALQRRGHVVEVVADFAEMMGHAGALVRHPDGSIEGAADPRSDGKAAGF